MKPQDYLEENFLQVLDDLSRLVEIPSVSFPDFDHKYLQDSAELTAQFMTEAGLENVQLLNLSGVFPYVYGDHCHAPGKPTLLLYAHHDVQPPGRTEMWESPAFKPTRREGPGGERLYARGTADDKAGIFVHLAAIKSFLKSAAKLPVNVKVLIEGEEEIGSPNLEKFLNTYKNLVQADIMLLTDTANYDCGIPSLTVGLRGMVAVNIVLKSLHKTVHSGFWGGIAPDPVMALAKILAPLTDDNGNIAIKEILDLVPPLTDSEQIMFKHLPLNIESVRDQAGLLPNTEILSYGVHPMQQLWKLPCLTVNGIQASSRTQPGNVINNEAWAKLSIRLAPGMSSEKVLEILSKHLKKNIPWGLTLDVSATSGSDGWQINPQGKHRNIFDAAARAIKAGYGRDVVFAGCGATIPFVEPFAQALKGAPALLVGIEDPYTNAHGENESLLISDFKKACLSAIYMFEEISKTC